MRVEDPPIVLSPFRPARTDRPVLSITRALVFAIVLPLGTGCEAPVEATRPVVRDSTGVRIVEHAAIATEKPPVIASPAWTHGLEDGEYRFQGPLVGDLLPGGGVAIGDLGRDEIVVLSPGGERLAVLGGPGEGPGEIGRIRTVTTLTDGGVVVEDDGLGRLTVFGPDAQARTLELRGVLSPFRWRVVGAIGPESLILIPDVRPAFDEPWLRGAVLRYAPGRGIDTVTAFDLVQRQDPGAPNPFQPRGHVGAAGESVVVGRSDRPELTWFTPEGDLRQIVRWRVEPLAPSDSVWEAFETSDRIQRAPREYLDRWKRGADEPLPLYDGFIMANNGDVWLEPFTVETDLADRFTVLSHDGERWTRVHLPGPVRVLAASHDRVLGVARDALDVQYVVVYEFDGGTWHDRTDEETP